MRILGAIVLPALLAGMYRPVRDLMMETQRLPMIRWTRLGETLSEPRGSARDDRG
jgi:hypothetical protein